MFSETGGNGGNGKRKERDGLTEGVTGWNMSGVSRSKGMF